LPLPEFEGDWDAWGEAMGASALSYVQEVIPAVAPILPPDAVTEMEMEVEDGLSELQHNASPESIKLREELAQLREQLRHSKEEYRDNLRELREIEREKYQAEQQGDALDNKRAELEKRIKENQKIMDIYSQKMEDYRKQRLEKTRKKRSQLINETLVALCDYPASLKALDNNEYVTLIFDDFGEKRGQDKIFVFKKSDIVSCESSVKGIERLTAKAIVYSQ
jgi:seryl-tRNA synthetase